MIRFAAAIAACVVAGGVAAHPSVAVAGAKLVCSAAGGGPVVHVWIGIVEDWADHGLEPPDADHPLIYHAQVAVPGAGELDVVGHMPFDSGAFVACRPVDALGFEADTGRLREGYGVWRVAAIEGGAGAWGITPSEAYAAVLAARDGG